jgi:tetratricopeptide (TPR) repeat protein
MNLLDECATQQRGTMFAYRTIRSLFTSNAEEALKSARKARVLADVEKAERDIILAEYLIGAAYLLKGNLVEAEKHLTEALTRDRKINLVELEPDILLEFAKLRFKENHKEEAFTDCGQMRIQIEAGGYTQLFSGVLSGC